MDKAFLSIQEAAEWIDKSSQTIRRMIKRGDLQAQRIKTPQGFHYVIAREELEPHVKIAQKKAPQMLPESPIQPLSNSTIQNEINSQEEAPESILTNQSEISTSQTYLEPQLEADIQVFDKKIGGIPTSQSVEKPIEQVDNEGLDKNAVLKELWKLLEQHHNEKLALIRVMEQLQQELDLERKKPRSLMGYIADWFMQRRLPKRKDRS